MKLPYSIQGALFAPACASLLFFLKITCPSGNSGMCFADNFITPVFLPLPFIERFVGEVSSLAIYEPLVVLGYWLIVGLLAGFCFDLARTQE